MNKGVIQMKKAISKVIATILSLVLITAGFINMPFAVRDVAAAEKEENLGANIACEDHMLGTFSGVPACVNENGDLHICENNFPDKTFCNYILKEYNGQQYISYDECKKTETISFDSSKYNIEKLNGIEFFSSLKSLFCSGYGYAGNLKEINLSNNKELTKLYCEDNQLTKLDTRNNEKLTGLSCENNMITSLDVSNNKELFFLYCGRNDLTEIDISNNTVLESFWCSGNSIKELDVSKNSALKDLRCDNNELMRLDLSNNILLQSLQCGHNPIEILDLSNNANLDYLECEYCNLIDLNIKNNTDLHELYCANNDLKNLDLSNNTVLNRLRCGYNNLAELDLSMNVALNSYYLFQEQSIDLECVKLGDVWVVDLNDRFEDGNFDKVKKLSNGDLNFETGIISFESKPTTFTYEYDTGRSKHMPVTAYVKEHVHTGIIHHEAVAATCHSTGTVEYWTCSSDKCEGKYFSDANCVTEITSITTPIDTNNHDGETEIRNAVEATCSVDGYTGDTYCLGCNQKIADGKVISATSNHIDADGKWESDETEHWHTCICGKVIDTASHTGGEATCVNKAVCAVCGIEYGEVNADNHKNTEIRDAVTATEEQEGYTGDTWCIDCNTKISEGEVIPKLDHSHNMIKIEAKEATHEEDGNIEYYTCSKCGKVYKDEDGKYEIKIEETIIKALGHDFSANWQSDKDNHWHECSCGEVNDKAAHEAELKNAKEATETEKGYTGDKVCKVCGYVIEQDEEIPAMGGASSTPGGTDDSSEENQTQTPQTGDESSICTFYALLIVSGSGLVLWTLLNKKRKKN